MSVILLLVGIILKKFMLLDVYIVDSQLFKNSAT